MNAKMEVPGVHIIMDETWECPILDVDGLVKLNQLRVKLRPIIRKYKLGPYIVVRTSKGFKVAFTHDTNRSRETINNIILDYVGLGLCDERYYEVGIQQKWRGCRVSGKYKCKDMFYVAQYTTGYKGQPNPISYMLDAMFKAFY